VPPPLHLRPPDEPLDDEEVARREANRERRAAEQRLEDARLNRWFTVPTPIERFKGRLSDDEMLRFLEALKEVNFYTLSTEGEEEWREEIKKVQKSNPEVASYIDDIMRKKLNPSDEAFVDEFQQLGFDNLDDDGVRQRIDRINNLVAGKPHLRKVFDTPAVHEARKKYRGKYPEFAPREDFLGDAHRQEQWNMEQENAYRDFAVLTPNAKSFLEKVRRTNFAEMTPEQLDKWAGEIHTLTVRDPVLRREMRQLLGSSPNIHPTEGRWVPDPDELHRYGNEIQYGRADIRRGLLDLQVGQRRRQMERAAQRRAHLEHDIQVADWIRTGIPPPWRK
jgi:hypothetical protein